MRCNLCTKKTIAAGLAFTRYTCKGCEKVRMHSNTAIPKYCYDCSEKLNVCERCGRELGVKNVIRKN